MNFFKHKTVKKRQEKYPVLDVHHTTIVVAFVFFSSRSFPFFVSLGGRAFSVYGASFSNSQGRNKSEAYVGIYTEVYSKAKKQSEVREMLEKRLMGSHWHNKTLKGILLELTMIFYCC